MEATIPKAAPDSEEEPPDGGETSLADQLCLLFHRRLQLSSPGNDAESTYDARRVELWSTFFRRQVSQRIEEAGEAMFEEKFQDLLARLKARAR